jgi:hypothetical protein
MWNADRGYGFIADDSGGPDMFPRAHSPPIVRPPPSHHRRVGVGGRFDLNLSAGTA